MHRHAELMKKIMSMVEEDGRELEVHAYPIYTLCACIIIVRSRNKFWETNLTKMGDLRTPRPNMRD